jgi:GT2 family glycosyltransferase
MDTLAEVLARMHGWEVRAFPHLPVFHHKSISGRFPMILKRHFTSGRAEYSLGYHPLFEILKCARRLKESPYVVGSIARWAGFFFACLRQEKRVASAEMIRSLRREQVSRIRWML